MSLFIRPKPSGSHNNTTNPRPPYCLREPAAFTSNANTATTISPPPPLAQEYVNLLGNCFSLTISPSKPRLVYRYAISVEPSLDAIALVDSRMIGLFFRKLNLALAEDFRPFFIKNNIIHSQKMISRPSEIFIDLSDSIEIITSSTVTTSACAVTVSGFSKSIRISPAEYSALFSKNPSMVFRVGVGLNMKELAPISPLEKEYKVVYDYVFDL